MSGTGLVDETADLPPDAAMSARRRRQFSWLPRLFFLTKRKKAEEALRRSEERFRAFVTACSDVVYRMSPDWREMRQLQGRDFLADTASPDCTWLQRYIHPDDRPRVTAIIDQAIRTKSMFELEHRVVRADGSLGWTHSRALPIMDDRGEIIEWFGAARDITAQKAAEEELRRANANLAQTAEALARTNEDLELFAQSLREGNERHRMLVETMLQGVVHQAADGKIIAMNPAAERVLGVSPQEFMGNSSIGLEEYTVREDGSPFPGMEHPAMVALRTGRTVRGVVMGVFNYRENRRRWIMIDAVPVYESGQAQPKEVYTVFEDITDRRQAEAALRESEERYRTLFSSMTEGFATHEIITNDAGEPVDYRFLDINSAFERLTGLKRGDVVGRTLSEVLPGDDPRWLKEYGRVALTGEPAQFENYSPALKRWYEVFAYRPAPRQFAVVFMDISARKPAEAALRRSEERYRSFVQASAQVVWTTNPRGEVDMEIPAWQAFVGQTAEQARGFGWMQAIHPDDRDRVAAAWARASETRGIYEVEYRLRRNDGAWRDILARGVPVFADDGQVREYVGTCIDITERKQAEDALRQSEQRFRTLANTIPQLAWWANADGYITWYNDNWYRYTGTTPQQMEGWGWQSVHDPARLPEVMERWKDALATGQPFDMIFPLRGADGVPRHFLTRVQPLKDASGRVVQWFGTNTDVEEIKRAEERFELLTETAEQLLRAVDPQQVVESLCSKVMRHLDCHAFFNFLVDKGAGRLRLNACAGIGVEEARKVKWLDYGIAVCGCAARDRMRIVAEHIPTTPDPRTELVRSYGIKAYACHPLLGPGGDLIGTLSFGTRSRETFNEDDLSLMKAVADEVAVAMTRAQGEQSLREAITALERSNTELEQFAYISAHDLQEPLRQVRAFANLLRDRHSEKLDGKALQYLGFVHEGAGRMSDLVSGLLAYGRIRKPATRPSQIPADCALDAAVRDLRPAVEESGASITRDLLPSLAADPGHLEQVFENLLSNAIKFRRDGFKPEIHVACRLEGSHWLFEVRDNGIGIERQYQEKAFEIFQRLCARDKYPGAGIGLSICKKIVEQYGGKIWIENTPGGGATVCFSWPQE